MAARELEEQSTQKNQDEEAPLLLDPTPRDEPCCQVNYSPDRGSKEKLPPSQPRKASSDEKKPSPAGRARISCQPLRPAKPSTSGGTTTNKTKAKPLQKMKRERLNVGEMVSSEAFTWKVVKLLGAGGFGDVYKVGKVECWDKKEYALKTEMIHGNRRMLRLKIEVTVLKKCHEQPDPDRKRHFVEFVDRGITDKFKFLVMGLVGPSLEDVRRSYLQRNYSRGTALNASLQCLKAISDLHYIGWLHRDIKPANFAVGLGDREELVVMLDFGIARKIFKGDTRQVKQPRSMVKFLGTVRFASRACHHQLEQGRKDDLETWIYLCYDLLDEEHGLPWKGVRDKLQVILLKEKFFLHGCPKVYHLIPKDLRKVCDYVNSLSYADEPDYKYLEQLILATAREAEINVNKKPDWVGRIKKKPLKSSPSVPGSSSSTSSDNRQSSDDISTADRSSRVKKAAAAAANKKKSAARKSPSQLKKTSAVVGTRKRESRR